MTSQEATVAADFETGCGPDAKALMNESGLWLHGAWGSSMPPEPLPYDSLESDEPTSGHHPTGDWFDPPPGIQGPPG
jgi:hypothetical protein